MSFKASPRITRLSLSRRAASARAALAGLLAVVLALGSFSHVAFARVSQDPAADTSATTGKTEFVPGELLVRFRPGGAPAPDSATDAVPLADGRIVAVEFESFGGSELVEGLRLAHVPADSTLDAVAALNTRPDVLYAAPNYIRRKSAATPNDPSFGTMYALRNTGQSSGIVDADIDADEAWDITRGSSSVVVGIIDEGVDIDHPDLAANIWRNTGETPANGIDDDGNGFVDDVNGWDFFHDNSSVFDSADGEEHGTHVAGTVGARGNNGVGVTGVNWEVSLMPLKVLGPNGGADSDFIAAYHYAKLMRQRGVNLRVLNNSYGGSGYQPAAADAIRELAEVGILFVASAGNDGTDNFQIPHYPSDYALPNVISVASTDRFDNRSSFSNFGARVVTLGAPGSQILSTTPGNTYSSFSGTSMAAPHVAGAAALAVAANPSLTLPQLYGAVVYGGDPITALSARTRTGRRLNARRAVETALEGDTTAPSPAQNFRITGQSGRIVSLAWEAPGDDQTSGAAADYDLFFVNASNGARTLLPTSLMPASGGTTQTVDAPIPYLNFAGTLELKTFDNAGNNSTATVAVTIPDNPGINPYTVTEGPPVGLSTGGDRLFLNGDDKYLSAAGYNLPFTFPFFGYAFNAVVPSTNGALYFFGGPGATAPPLRENGDADDVPGSVERLGRQAMIAGMWDDLDLRTCMRSDADIYVVKPDAGRIIFRWQGVRFQRASCPASPAGEQVNFELELRSDGTIVTRYGAGNTNLHPIVGLGGGNPDPYVVASHTSDLTTGAPARNLNNAPSLTFARRAGISSVQFSAANFDASESDTVGAIPITVTRTGETGSTQTVSYETTSGGTATANSDYMTTAGYVAFLPGETSKSFNVPIINDALAEPQETVNLRLYQPTGGASLGTPATAVVTITDNDLAGVNTVQLNAGSIAVTEGADRKVDFTVTRTGNTWGAASIDYVTRDVTASDKSDYLAAMGTLSFAPGETSKTVSVFIIDDAYGNSNTGGRGDAAVETFELLLSNPAGCTLGSPNLAQVQIGNNETADGPNPVRTTTNGAPSFDAEFYVRQHYYDFLSREPDAAGLQFWANQITSCGADDACLDSRKQNVSAAFFLSKEFQQTGYLVYRAHQAAFNTGKTLRLSTFLPETQEVGRGFVDGQPGAETVLEQNRVRYFEAFVQRPEFIARYRANLTPAEFVDALNQNTGGSLSTAERDALVADYNTGVKRRAQVLRAVVEDADFNARERNRAFVLMQYFGYLRRNPDAAPNTDFSGYDFWLQKLEQFGGNFVGAEMVKAFITSDEYKLRFGL